MAGPVYINPVTDSQRRRVFSDINTCLAGFTTDIAALEEDVDRTNGSTFTADADVDAAEFVYVTGAGTCDLADASALSTGITIGAAEADIASAASGNIVSTGIITTSGLTAGARYFLSGVTPGAIVTAPDDTSSGAVAICVGFAISTTEFYVNIQAPRVY